MRENWIEIAKQNIERLRQISILHHNNPTESFIRYRTLLELNERGKPIKKCNNTFEFKQHTLTCHPYSMVACFALCEANSRKKEDGSKRRMRTEGTNASYMSEKHFNNQLTENLFSDEVFQTLNKHPSIKACSFIEGYIEWTAQST